MFLTPCSNLTELSYRWPNGSQALNQCSLNVPGPGLWMLVGSNGSGKSTLFRLIAGLMQPQEGGIHQLSVLPWCSRTLIINSYCRAATAICCWGSTLNSTTTAIGSHGFSSFSNNSD